MLKSLDKLIAKTKTDKVEIIDEQEYNEALKNPSTKLSSLLGKKGFSTNQDIDEELRIRGFEDLITLATNTSKEKFIKTIKAAEYNHKTQFTSDKIINEEIDETQRSKNSMKQIEHFLAYIDVQNSSINYLPQKIDLGFDPNAEIQFNEFTEGSKALTKIVFDTEADKFGQTILNCAINYNAKRFVLNLRTKIGQEPIYSFFKTTSSWDLIIIESPNPFDACFIADIETTLGAILKSSNQQGSEELIHLTKKLLKQYLPIDKDLIYQILMNSRRSTWICHNNKYDINKINNIYKYKRGQRLPICFLNEMKTEFVKIKSTQNDLYSIKIGNSKVGLRFLAQSNAHYSSPKFPKFQLTIAPEQADSVNLAYGIDTLLLANAGNFKKKDLGSLSKGLVWEKLEIDGTDKIFSKNDLDQLINCKNIQANLLTSLGLGDITDSTNCVTCKAKLEKPTNLLCDFCRNEFFPNILLNDKLKYNVLDCFATLAVYAKFTEYFDLRELGKQLDLDFKREKHPFLSKINTTATLSKYVLSHYLAKKSELTIEQIEYNIEKERLWFNNYALTYMGGANDPAIAGTIELTEEKTIEYNDYRSQYPHAARLICAEEIFILSAQGILHRYLTYDKKKIISDLRKLVNSRIVDTYSTIPYNFFQKLIGNATIKIKNTELVIRKTGERQTELVIKKNDQITIHLIDLAGAIIRKSILEKTHSDKIFDQIDFVECERLNLNDVQKHGEELFTNLYNLRKSKEIEAIKNGLSEDEAKKMPISIQLKIIMNAIYGLSAEGTSKDYIGKFMNYAIASSITSCSRFLTTHAKILYLENNDVFIYSDTDSGIALANPETHNKVRRIFDDTIPFDPEPKYKKINKICVLGKKKYGIEFINQNDELEIDIKTHGAGREVSKKDKKLYASLYKGIFNNDSKETIFLSTLEHYDYWRQISYDKEFGERMDKKNGKKTRYGNASLAGINKILNQGKIIETLQYNDLDINIYKLESKMICNKCKKETKEFISVKEIDFTKTIQMDQFTQKEQQMILKLQKSSLNTTTTIKRKTEKSDCCYSEITKIKHQTKYLVCNFTELEKGSFGNYYNLDEIIFCVFAPVANFNEFCINILNQSNKLPKQRFKQKKGLFTTQEENWINFTYRFNEFPLSTADLLDSFDYATEKDITKLKLLSKIFSVDLNSFKTEFWKEESFFEYLIETIQLDNQINDYLQLIQFLDTEIPKIKNNKKLNKFLNESEEPIKLKMYEKIQQTEKQENQYIEPTDYLSIIAEQPKLRKKILSLISFDKKYFSLEPEPQPSNFPYDYVVMNPQRPKKTITDTIIQKKNISTQKIDVDGWNLAASCILPDIDYNTHLQSEQNKYYTQAVINLGLFFNQAYLYLKHQDNPVLLQEKLQKLLNKAPEDWYQPKKTKDIPIPLRMRIVYPEEQKFIPKKDLEFTFTDLEIEKLTKIRKRATNEYSKDLTEKEKKITDILEIHCPKCSETIHKFNNEINKEIIEKNGVNNSTYLMMKTVTIEETQTIVFCPTCNHFIVREEKDWNKRIKDIRKREFTSKMLFGKLFSFEILSKEKNPTEYNASLRLGLLVSNNRDQEKRTFRAEMRLNPSQRNMHNLELFRTTIDDIENNAFIIKELILDVIKFISKKQNNEIKMRFFTQKASTHLEDIQQQEDASYALKQSYLLQAFLMLKKSLNYLRYRIVELGITKNIPVQSNINRIYPLLEQIARNSVENYHFKDEKTQNIATRLRTLDIASHRMSKGFTINNKENKSALTTYVKDKRQYLSKCKRVAIHNDEKVFQKALDKLKQYKFQENILRIEYTIFSFNKVTLSLYQQLLDYYENRIIEKDEELSEIETPLPYSNQKELEKAYNFIIETWNKIPSGDEPGIYQKIPEIPNG